MTNSVISRRINSVDIVRLICALLVVTEHTMPFMDIYPDVWTAFYKVCVLAVPYFFVVSGFFVAQSDNKMKVLKQYVKFYLIWSLVYDVWWFLDWAFLGEQTAKIDFVTFIKYRMIEFFGLGSFYHMWYLWALIFLTILTIMAEKIKLEKFLLVLMLICFFISLVLEPYYGILVTPHAALKQFVENLLGKWWFDAFSNILIRAIPYFYLGYWLSKWKVSKRYKITGWMLAGLAILYTAEQIIINQLGIARDVALTFFMYFLTAAIVLWLLQHPLGKHDKLARFSRESANFIYFVHALVIDILLKIFGEEKMTIHFVWAMIICMGLAVFRYWMQSKKRVKV